MTALLLAAAAVGLLYLLRPPARLVTVPSTLLWRRLVERSAKRRRWLRWLLSLLLSLLVALLMTSVLFRIEPRTGSLREPVLLVDNTGSMGSRLSDGTRLDRARRVAERLLERSTGQITVADLAGTFGPRTYDSVDEARRALLGIRWEPAARPTIPSTLEASADRSASSPIFLLTDDPAALERLELPGEIDRSRVEVLTIGEPATNVGIVRFAVDREQQPALGERTSSAFLEILNGGDEAVTARLTVTVRSTEDLLADPDPDDSDLEPLLRRDLEIEPGRTWSGVLDLERARRTAPTAQVALRASVAVLSGTQVVGDDQPLDDAAWVVVEPGRTAVVWQTTGSPQWPPDWLRRAVETSDLVAADPGPGVVAVAPPGDSDAGAPCIELSLPSAERDGEAPLVELEGVRLRLPGRPVMELPWTAVVVAEVEEPASSGRPWLEATTLSGGSVPLVLPPTGEDRCVRWLFDPSPTGLVTRAELPALVDEVLAATADRHRQDSLREVLDGERRVLVDGSWRTVTGEPAAEPVAPGASFRVGPEGFSVLPPLGAGITDIASASSPAGDSGSLTGTEGTFLWPGRAVLLALIAALVVAETLTRFAGWTE